MQIRLAVGKRGYMKQSSEKKIYLYGRLSHEDESIGDSNSIVNQRKILEKYAQDNGFTNYEFICDDGYSGADFDTRPAFLKMIEDVEMGNVGTIVVKDAYVKLKLKIIC
jgi:DNA invertase Pin-like site-specific DNA recombinase